MNLLRQRAWWLIRQQRTFTLPDLLNTLCDGTEKNAYHSLMKYVVLLERVGVLQRLKRKAPGLSSLSRGYVIWRLSKDVGRHPPVARFKDKVAFDPNSNSILAEQFGEASPAKETGSLTALAAQTRDARQAVLVAVRAVQQREYCSSKQAVSIFLAEIRAGLADPSLTNNLSLSVMQLGGGGQNASAPGVPSARTLLRWLSATDLTPKSLQPKAEADVLPWMVKALRIKSGLRVPSMSEVHRRLTQNWNPDWGEPVSYSVVHRFLQGKRKTLPFEKIKNAGTRPPRKEST